MLTRRATFLLTTLIAGAGRAAFAAPAADPAAQEAAARAFVQKTADALLQVINSNASSADKQARIRPLVDSSVDVDGIARFCLGRFWRTATTAQQNDYLKLFHAVLVKSITGRLGDYTGVKIDVGKAQTREEGVIVTTVITRPNNAPASLDWLVVTQGGAPKLADMIAEGTSLRITTRKDYDSYLTRNNADVGTLIAQLRKQASSDGA